VVKKSRLKKPISGGKLDSFLKNACGLTLFGAQRSAGLKVSIERGLNV